MAVVLTTALMGCGDGAGTGAATSGLSLVERFPATPLADTLLPNAAIADGDLTTGAGVNLGTSVTLAGDTSFRDVGLRFPAPPGELNTLYLWVDRPLPPDVAAAYGWSVYLSDDNASWTAVAVTTPIAFSALQNRFEMMTRPLQGRYVKVVARPLAPGVTSDSRFADVFVTELQAVFVAPVQALAP
jgi:hypothetical protein